MSSGGKTYQCLSCRLRTTAQQVPRRSFQTTTSQQQRRRKFPSIKAADLESPHVRPYTEREKKLLSLKYTPEQMEVIEAGEKAIDTADIAGGRMRDDPMRIKYLDDFSKMRPVLDRDLTTKEAQRMAKEKAEEAAKRGNSGENAEEQDLEALRLRQQTGLTEQEIRRLHVKNLVIHKVVNQTRMGKIQSLYVLTIAGDGNGMIGIGEGKAAEAEDAMKQSRRNAIRNMQPIARYEDRTIYGEVRGKVGASIVQLMARPPGFGNRCQHLIYEVARAAGLSDLAARTPRSRNKMNVVKAAFEALRSQRLPEIVARGRGRKMVDVRKVYYGGQVY